MVETRQEGYQLLSRHSSLKVVVGCALLELPTCALFGVTMATEKRGFARVSPETIQLCADRLGVQASEEVFSGLGEDVSFRIRQIADVSVLNRTEPFHRNDCANLQVACQFMHHSKRRRLTVDDMDKAMKYSGLEVWSLSLDTPSMI